MNQVRTGKRFRSAEERKERNPNQNVNQKVNQNQERNPNLNVSRKRGKEGFNPNVKEKDKKYIL